METVIDDPEGEGPFRSVKVLKSEAEVQHTTHINDLEEQSFHGNGKLFTDDEEEVALFTNDEETRGILEFAHEEEEQ